MDRYSHRALTGHLAMLLCGCIIEIAGLGVDPLVGSAAILFVFLAAAGASLPDIDQRIPVLTHRGPFHALETGLILGYSAATVIGYLLENIGPVLRGYPIVYPHELPMAVGLYFGVIVVFIWSAHLIGDYLASSKIAPVRVSMMLTSEKRYFGSARWRARSAGPLNHLWPWSVILFLLYLSIRFTS